MPHTRRLLILLTLALGACQWDRYLAPEIRQGNELDLQAIHALRLGMPREEVAFLLGEPVLESSLQKDEWNYVYDRRKHDTTVQRQWLRLYFHNQRLSRIDGSMVGTSHHIPIAITEAKPSGQQSQNSKNKGYINASRAPDASSSGQQAKALPAAVGHQVAANPRHRAPYPKDASRS